MRYYDGRIELAGSEYMTLMSQPKEEIITGGAVESKSNESLSGKKVIDKIKNKTIEENKLDTKKALKERLTKFVNLKIG